MRLLVAFSIFAIPCWPAGLEVKIEAQTNDPAQVGAGVILSATATGSASPAQIRFMVAPPGQGYFVFRDYNSRSSQARYVPMSEGTYSVVAVARDADTGEIASSEVSFEVASRLADDGQPAITATAHPLVLLYSAPPCAEGIVTAIFARAGAPETETVTPAKACDGERSVNFWIAGLEAESEYTVRHEVRGEDDALLDQGPDLRFTTGAIPASIPAAESLRRDRGRVDESRPVLLESLMMVSGARQIGSPTAYNLDGKPIWYYDPTSLPTLTNMFRPLPGGSMLVQLPIGPAGRTVSTLREIDLAGNLVTETNVEAVNRQLAALGYPPLTQFHHDALRLPGGRTLALGKSVRDVPGESPDAPARRVDGDVLVLLDAGYQVLWVWDSFAKLDLNRKATLGDLSSPGVEDWTHSNAIEYLADGNLLLSMRSQDWVIKIDFQDGAGSGDVIWRFGKGGDFQLASSNDSDWFSHQHDPHFDGQSLWLFDNGNGRNLDPANLQSSRGQVYVIDESALTARLRLSADLGTYSSFLGSAARLPNGNYHFLSGAVYLDNQILNQSVEVSPSGGVDPIRYILQVRSQAYRSFRLADLYHVDP